MGTSLRECIIESISASLRIAFSTPINYGTAYLSLGRDLKRHFKIVLRFDPTNPQTAPHNDAAFKVLTIDCAVWKQRRNEQKTLIGYGSNMPSIILGVGGEKAGILNSLLESQSVGILQR